MLANAVAKTRSARCAAGLIAASLLLFSGAAAAENTPVRTAEAAVEKARKTWAALYEKGSWHKELSPKETARFEPYTASLSSGKWTVRGTIPKKYHGVTLVTTVQQEDGIVQVQFVDVK